MQFSDHPGARRRALATAAAAAVVMGAVAVAGLIGTWPPAVTPASAATAASPPGPCYGAGYSLPAGRAPQLDVVSFGLFFNCTDHSWQLDVTTSDNWRATDFQRLALYFNTDANHATGCNGYDRAVVGSVQNGVIQAEALITPTCDIGTFLRAAPAVIVHPRPNALSLAFTNNDLGNPPSFAWHGELLGASEVAPDRFPAVSDLTERGYPPVAPDNPCPPATSTTGLAQRVAVVEDSHTEGAVVMALREAGLKSVAAKAGGVVRFTGDPRAAAHALGAAGIRASVSTDRLSRFATVPNDPGLAGQWNLAAINVQPAWDVTPGSPSVAVADLDGGVDGTHPDLQGKLLPGFDVATGGALAAGNSDSSDGHGTAVAGIIAATTNNGFGLASIGWQTKVVEVKLSDPPPLSEIVAGIRWATDNGYRIINLSIAGCADPAEGAAVDYARQHGALVVAAAGNDALDGNPRDFPAAFPGVIGVGATSRAGVRALYSEMGMQVALVAPGGSADGSPSDDLPLLAIGGGTRTGAGTSFAAPQVSASAALILAAAPTATADDAGALVVATTSHVQTSPDAGYGHGLLNTGAAVMAATHLRRAAGLDRYRTAVALSRMGWPSASSSVYIASAKTFPDALATGALAGVRPGPVLLTDTCSLPAVTAAELHRLQPDTVYMVGGTQAICPAVADAILNATGLIPVRIAGPDRYATDAQVVEAGWPNPVDTVYLTTGVNFPDGLTGSARAAKDGAPLLLSDTCSLPPPISSEIVRLAPKTVKVLGGSAAVCPAVLDAIAAADAGVNIVRIAGPTRIDTGVLAVADGWKDSPLVILASGANFPDALSAGAFAALHKLPLLINDSCTADPQVVRAASSLTASSLLAIGGSSALCGAAVAPVVLALGP